MHHKQIFRSQLLSVFNEVVGVVVLTGNSVIYIVFCHSIINETRWEWSLAFISMFKLKYVSFACSNLICQSHSLYDASPDQRCTQKIFIGGGSFSGIWWSFVFAVSCLWHHNLTSYSCFQTNLLAKFVAIICYFSTSTPLILYVNALNINY